VGSVPARPPQIPPAPAVTAAIAAPQPLPAAPPAAAPIPQAASHRGLYMGLGALVVVVVLIAAGLYMPSWKKASAADSGQPQVQVTTPASGLQPPAEQPKPAAAEPKKLLAKNTVPAPTGNNAAPSQPAADTAALDAIEHEIDQLTSRAAAVNNSLDTLQHQQQAEGYGLRGDIAAKQASMKLNLSKAQTAIGANDGARAKRYADLAASDVEALERFLGR
jgi:hypothetical protein